MSMHSQSASQGKDRKSSQPTSLFSHPSNNGLGKTKDYDGKLTKEFCIEPRSPSWISWTTRHCGRKNRMVQKFVFFSTAQSYSVEGSWKHFSYLDLSILHLGGVGPLGGSSQRPLFVNFLSEMESLQPSSQPLFESNLHRLRKDEN